MTEISDTVRLLFETSIDDDDGRYTISIPEELIENGSVSTNEPYRVALLATEQDETVERDSETERTHTSEPEPRHPQAQGPPVEEGEVRAVEIDTLGDQGDGIAKVERGFIVIVPGTKPGDRVEVEITDVKETVAFAEPVGEATVR